MTIPEMAEKHGVSKQLVYRKLKSIGLDVTTLMSDKKGILSPSGERVLENLLTTTGARPSSPVQLTDEVDQLQSDLNTAHSALETANEQIRQLQTAAEVLTVKLTAAESERDFLRAALEREQTVAARLLPAAPIRKLTLMERLTGRVRQDQPTSTDT